MGTDITLNKLITAVMEIDNATSPLANESFDQMVERNFTLLSNDGGCITRKDFLTWRNQFYLDELQGVKQRLRTKILDRSAGVKFPSGNDNSDNQDFVENILDEFVLAFDMKQQMRRIAKRKFLASVSKPVLSRAFFSWKFACRSKNDSSNNQMVSSGMFAEPVQRPKGRGSGVSLLPFRSTEGQRRRAVQPRPMLLRRPGSAARPD